MQHLMILKFFICPHPLPWFSLEWETGAKIQGTAAFFFFSFIFTHYPIHPEFFGRNTRNSRF